LDNSTPNCAATQSTTVGSGLIHYWSGEDVKITAIAVNHVFGDRNPSGFLLSGSGFANDVPEPATYATFSLAALAFAVQKYRKIK
jgi:hypothetical protein